MSESIEIVPVPVDELKNAVAHCDRFTAQLAVYHESCGNPTEQVTVQTSVMLKTKEQTYQRRKMLTDGEWSLLDYGWLASYDVGYIVIENHAGRGLQVNPLPEERERLARQKVFVSCNHECGSDWEVPPGGMFIAHPSSVFKIRLRASEGLIPITITAFPR